MWESILDFHSLGTCFLFLFCKCVTVHLLKRLIGVNGEGIHDTGYASFCYSKIDLPPAHTVSAKNVI